MRYFMLVLCFVWMLPLNVVAQSTLGPETVVRQMVNELIEVLKAREDNDVINKQDMAAIHDVANKYFDFSEMAKRSLSKNWKKLDTTQQKKFVKAFKALLERSYGNRLSGFQNQTIEYLGAQVKGDSMVVSTQVAGKDRSTSIEYKLHQKDAWLIYDIQVEGQSLVSTYRSDFKKIIKKKGFDGLMSVLQSKLDQLQAG